MGSTNWSYLTGSLAAGSVARGVSAGFTPPNGGDSFIYGFHSLDSSAGAVGLYCNETDFNPLKDDNSNDTGGSIRAAIKRGVSGGTTGFSPFLFIGSQGDTVNDVGYMLGLSDNDPNNIILYKGALANGIDPTADGILLTSSDSFLGDVWHHLRLDMIVNPNGDVVLNVYQHDLDTYLVTEDSNWVTIDGMEDGFIDDALGVNSAIAGLEGELPYVGGRVGFGFVTSEASRRGYFDHVIVKRQAGLS
jgi:hypothetical protein